MSNGQALTNLIIILVVFYFASFFVAAEFAIVSVRKSALESALEAGERLIIDSFKKEVYKLTSTGERVNMFSDRIVNGNYVFTKISKGTSGFSIFSGGTFDWNLKVYSEGSEPAWI